MSYQEALAELRRRVSLSVGASGTDEREAIAFLVDVMVDEANYGVADIHLAAGLLYKMYVCPNCNSEDTKEHGANRLLCIKCGHNWRKQRS